MSRVERLLSWLSLRAYGILSFFPLAYIPTTVHTLSLEDVAKALGKIPGSTPSDITLDPYATTRNLIGVFRKPRKPRTLFRRR